MSSPYAYKGLNFHSFSKIIILVPDWHGQLKKTYLFEWDNSNTEHLKIKEVKNIKGMI